MEMYKQIKLKKKIEKMKQVDEELDQIYDGDGPGWVEDLKYDLGLPMELQPLPDDKAEIERNQKFCAKYDQKSRY